jgi:hypothetical protein
VLARLRGLTGAGGPGRVAQPDVPDERGEAQRRVDVARKKLWQTFALCWFGQPELLGWEQAASFGAAALDKRLRSPDCPAICELLREARAAGAPDEAIVGLLDVPGEVAACEPDSDQVPRAIIPVEEPVPDRAQLRRTASSCTLRGTGLETRSCQHCTLGRRCPSGARMVVTAGVGSWLSALLDALERAEQSHPGVASFIAYLDPVSTRPQRAPALKRALAPDQRSPPKTMKEPSPTSRSRPVKKRSSKPSPLASPADEMKPPGPVSG